MSTKHLSVTQLEPSSSRYSNSVDPVSVDMVRVNRRPKHVNIEIHGVPTSGVIDTRAGITMIGGELLLDCRREILSRQMVPHGCVTESSLNYTWKSGFGSYF